MKSFTTLYTIIINILFFSFTSIFLLGKSTLLNILSGEYEADQKSTLKLSSTSGTFFVHQKLRRGHINQHHLDGLEQHLNKSSVQVLQQYGGESIRERDARQMVSKSSEGAAHEWSTVDCRFLFLLPPSNLFHCHCLVLLYLKHPNKSFLT